MRDQLRAEHAGGVIANLIQALGELDSACLAAAAGVDLGLDDPQISAEFLGCLDGGVRCFSCYALRHRDAVFGEQRLGLVFVKVHCV